MLFYKVRQISTGLFFDGGNYSPKFSQHGARYEKAAPCKAALTRFATMRRKAEENAADYVTWGKVPQYLVDEIELLRPEDFEIVPFEEIEVKATEQPQNRPVKRPDIEGLQKLVDSLAAAKKEAEGVANIWHWVHRSVETCRNSLNWGAGNALAELLAYIKELEAKLK